jgi:hypothetical protein
MKKLAEEKKIEIAEENPKAKEIKVNAMTFCRLNAVNKLYHNFVKKNYPEDVLKTSNEWKYEFRSQKVID